MNSADRSNGRRHVEDYFNTGCITRRDTLLSAVLPKASFHHNAEEIMRKARQLTKARCAGAVQWISVDVYSGSNAHVRELAAYLESELADDLLAAYVHGSLATGEEIAYSDFDALAVLRTDVFERRERLVSAAMKMSEANRIMRRFDPLQHHGWFILTQGELADYPQEYFPVESLRAAKSLLRHTGTSLCVTVDHERVDYDRPLLEATAAIVDRLQARRYPRNLYELKGLLSRFMLLPALYCAARNHRGYHKGECFQMVREYVGDDAYRVMDEVSRIREAWNYDVPSWRRYLLTTNRRGLRRLCTGFAPPIPVSLRGTLTEDFFQRMRDFCLVCNRSIRGTAIHRPSTTRG